MTSIQQLINAARAAGIPFDSAVGTATSTIKTIVDQSTRLNGVAYTEFLDKHYLAGSVETERVLGKFITQDAKTLVLLNNIRTIAMRSESVLLQGPPGVGKEILATALHGHRVGGFIAINCAELSHNLMRAELFGHMKNTFTGAGTSNRNGLVAAAEQGTLFFDEIGELSLEFQGILLRLLESRGYRPLGHTDAEIPTNARFVFATNRNLSAMVADGTFRQDLFDRINVFAFSIPSLHERGSEELKLICNSLGGDHDSYVAAMASHYTAHLWPGNVRELRNFISRVKLLGMEYAIRSL